MSVTAQGLTHSQSAEEDDKQTARPKLGWKGAVDKLAKSGALGTSKRWTVVLREIKETTNALDKYDVSLRKHTYSATIGTAKREVAKPAPCPVHSYNTALSTLRSKHAATFGKASLDKPPPTAGPAIHSYSSLGSSFTPKLGATFGRASTGRGEPPRTACSVHSYSPMPPATPLARRSPTRGGGTFGTAPARPGSIAMTRTGLLLSSKPSTLPPLEPLTKPSKTAAATHALGFASKLKRAVSSAESVGAATQLEGAGQGGSADILILDNESRETPPQSTGEAATRATHEEQRNPSVAQSGDATPTELEVGEGEGAGNPPTSSAAELVELLNKEAISPVRRKLTMSLVEPTAPMPVA